MHSGQAEELNHARPPLQRVIKDLGRCLSRDHELRLKAIASLRDATGRKGGRLNGAEIESRVFSRGVRVSGQSSLRVNPLDPDLHHPASWFTASMDSSMRRWLRIYLVRATKFKAAEFMQ
jgi:hypothetical protein